MPWMRGMMVVAEKVVLVAVFLMYWLKNYKKNNKINVKY